MPTPGHYLFNSSTLTMLPALLCSALVMDTLAIWGRQRRHSEGRFACQAIRLSVRLSAWLTDAILCHTYEQSTESRWANKFITCLNALTINSAHTDVCVGESVCGCGEGCLLGVCVGCICFLLKDLHTHTHSY